MPGDAADLVTSFYREMVDEYSVAIARSYFAPDATIEVDGETFGVEEYYDRIRAGRGVELVDASIDHAIEDAGQVALWVSTVAIQVEPVYGVDPSGDPFERTEAYVFEVADGRIQRMRLVRNQTALLEELGLLADDPRTERVRDQFYAVLNRVLRHDLRNQLGVVDGHADDLLYEPETDPQAAGTAIRGATAQLLETVEKARTLQKRAIDAELAPEPVDIRAALVPVVERADGDVTIRGHGEDGDVVVTDRELLCTVVEELVENAVEHGSTSAGAGAREAAAGHESASPDPRARRDEEGGTPESDPHPSGGASDAPSVTVTVSHTDDGVEVTVADDGPGIPEAELAPLRADEETELLHGSGIGLWVVKWGITRLGGDVTFETGEGGTTVTLWVPDIA